MRVLVTGGADFIGGSVGVGLARRHPDWEILALDNLRARWRRPGGAAPGSRPGRG